jgi:hypothetical protein
MTWLNIHGRISLNGNGSTLLLLSCYARGFCLLCFKKEEGGNGNTLLTHKGVYIYLILKIR